MQHIVVVELENEGHPVEEGIGPGFEKTQRSGIGVTAGVNGQLKMVVRVVAGGIRRKTAGRAVLKALVNRQDNQLAGAAETAMIEQAGDIRPRAGIVAIIPTQDFLYAFRHGPTSSGAFLRYIAVPFRHKKTLPFPHPRRCR